MKPSFYIATNGLGVWYSEDLGENLIRMNSRMGMYQRQSHLGLRQRPIRPQYPAAGTNGGLFSLDRAKLQWSHVPTPMDERSKITALAFLAAQSRTDSGRHTVCCQYRSEDHGRPGGARSRNPEICSNMNSGASPEICSTRSIRRARLGGRRTRSRMAQHRRRRRPGARSARHRRGHPRARCEEQRQPTGVRSTDLGFHFSDDDGENWRKGTVDSPSHYMRAVAPRADHSGVVFLTNGDGPPGSWGRLMRSRDNGEHWEQVALPAQIDSTMWSVATNPADPKLLFASSCLGQLYRSTDGGETWTGLKRRLGEIRHVIWLPS